MDSFPRGVLARGESMTPSDFVKLHDYIDNCELFYYDVIQFHSLDK